MKGSFDGFPPSALTFLRDLAENNERAWFQARKAQYERDVQAPLRALVADLVTRFAARKVPLSADPLKALFRLHRDVRFSRDKRPYKTHAAAILSRDGSKDGAGLLYVHVAPEGSFAACGFYNLAPAAQEAVRSAIASNPAAFQTIVSEIQAAGLDLSRNETLVRMPRGLEQAAGLQIAPYLKLRNLIVRRPISAAELRSDRLPASIEAFAETSLGLLHFGWKALDGSAA